MLRCCASLEKLAKRIKLDHELSCELWSSGNHDARILATRVADPCRIDGKTAESWVKDLDNRMIVDAFALMLQGSPVVREKMEKWSSSQDEWRARTGWCLLAGLARDAADLPDSFFEAYLDIIRKEIHGRKNYVRQAMNGALIAIGLRNEALRKKATAAARAIGKVEVDHGDTACKTPDAIKYMEKTLARRQSSRRA
jgi:3-methyladenine DNA glycosylase AlkD